MDRPTCATCPYWLNNFAKQFNAAQSFSHCVRFPPHRSREEWDRGPDFAGYRITKEGEVCGEHPDFAASASKKNHGALP